MTLTRPNPQNIDEVDLVASLLGFEYNQYQDQLNRSHHVLTRQVAGGIQRMEFNEFSKCRHYLIEALWKDTTKSLRTK